MTKNRLTLLILLSLFSCSLDYKEARIAETMTEETPETILMNFTHTIVHEGRVAVILEAERAETYTAKEEIHLRGIHYREFGNDGTVLTEAIAGRAVFNTKSEDASFSDRIIIYSPEEETALFSESLNWTKEGKRLEANPNETVRLQKDDGSFVEGKGFSAGFREKKLEFSSARGEYVWEEE
ncbi:MAG TPA: LPS export ABC transporter periplasmic protein LptC [bacterium]|nr:LPS export ABC transporter periplasmic protein LptC [bacterium]